jgi:group I intron endonuclease
MRRLQPFFSTIEQSIGYLHLAEIQKIIRKELKGKSGIYGFLSKTNNKLYIGSSKILPTRFNEHIKGSKSNAILQKAINKYNLQDFIFIVFEYCETEELISREQFYIDNIKPEYNINPTAGSSLGYIHTEESIAKMSNKIFSTEARVKMSLAKLGKNHPRFGLAHSEETKVLMSLALSGQNHPMHGKNHSNESKNKISISNGTPIFVYQNEGLIYINSFPSAIKAGEHFNVSYHTILKYTKSGKLFKNEWILSRSLISKE